ncbi:MAG: hypothetical protein ABI559_05730 [Chloroflexota bacterium]
MSSCVIVGGPGGFVVSTDSIVYKYASDDQGKVIGKVKGSTRKLFQVDPDILVAGTGNWNSYFPIFNAAAAMQSPRDEKVARLLEDSASQAKDSCVYVVHRAHGKLRLDAVRETVVSSNQPGVVSYPDPVINQLFTALYESEPAKAIRRSGLLGIAALVNGFNSLAATMCSDIAAPFDTVLFLEDGIFPFTGGVTQLPVATFI